MTTSAVERTHTTRASNPRFCPVCKDSATPRKVAVRRLGKTRTVEIDCPLCVGHTELSLVLKAWGAA